MAVPEEGRGGKGRGRSLIRQQDVPAAAAAQAL